LLSNLNAKQTGLILVLVPIVIELSFVAVIAFELVQSGRDYQRLSHVKGILIEMHKMQDMCVRTFYILSDKDNHSFEERKIHFDELMNTFRKPYTWGQLNLNENPELRPLIEDAEELREVAINLGNQTSIHRGFSHTSKTANRLQNEVLIHLAMEQERLAKEIIRIETSMVKHEPEDFKNLQLKFIGIICFGFLLNVAVAFLLIKVFIGAMQHRVEAVTHKGELLALGQTVTGLLGGKDELAEVDRVITDASSILAEIRWTESAVLDNAADIICSLDEKMRFSAVGASSIKLWGQAPDELMHKSIMSIITEETAAASRYSLERIRDDGEGQFENLVRTKEGSVRDSLWTVTWSPEKQNYYCVIKDVTEMRNVDRLKKHFIAMASHDIRSPLTAISMVLQGLNTGRRGILPEAVIKELSRAESNSQRLLALVNDFLELEKLEANRFSLDLSPVAASEICDSAKETLSGLANAAQVKIQSPKTDTIILGDERRLVQVMINLLSNAIKYSPKNSTLGLFIETDGNRAIIKVADEGPGIAQCDLELIFDKFRQTKTKPELNIKGTGLGLAIVKNIVEAHGGEVGATSELNKGTTFWFTIPRFADTQDDVE